MLNLKQIEEDLEISRRSLEMIARIHAQNERRATIIADVLQRLQARHVAMTEMVRAVTDRDAVPRVPENLPSPREFAATARQNAPRATDLAAAEAAVTRWNAAHILGQMIRIDYTGEDGNLPRLDRRCYVVARLLSEAWVTADGLSLVKVAIDGEPVIVPLSRVLAPVHLESIAVQDNA